jgi:hypothetical protein
MAVWPVLPRLIHPPAPVPGLKVESVRRPTPLLRVPLAAKPWREYICHFDKYPGGHVVRPSFRQMSDFADATGHSLGALAVVRDERMFV